MTHEVHGLDSLVNELLKYLDELGAPTARPLPDDAAKESLPIFLSQIYDVYRAKVFGRTLVLLISTQAEPPTPSELEKQLTVAERILESPVVFVFQELPSFLRQRLVRRRIPFLVPERQAYLPLALIDLRESPKGGSRVEIKQDVLSAPAQALVLYKIQKKEGNEPWPLNQWGEVLGYSRSTMTRVYRELTSASICAPTSKGRYSLLTFMETSQDLWQAAIPFLESPVRTRERVRVLDETIQLYDAGLTALSHITMMMDSREPVKAMSSGAFRAACEERRIEPTAYPDDDTIQIERWKYAPGLLSPDGINVDHLSLYLSLRDDPDERVQVSLRELLEEVKW